MSTVILSHVMAPRLLTADENLAQDNTAPSGYNGDCPYPPVITIGFSLDFQLLGPQMTQNLWSTASSRPQYSTSNGSLIPHDVETLFGRRNPEDPAPCYSLPRSNSGWDNFEKAPRSMHRFLTAHSIDSWIEAPTSEEPWNALTAAYKYEALGRRSGRNYCEHGQRVIRDQR